MSDMEELIGCKVNKILLDKEIECLYFDTDKGIKAYTAEGDCCSHSYYEHFNNVKDIVGQTVLEIIARDMPPVEQKEDDNGDIKVYGYSIKHTGAIPMDIEFRNSSNGYYGGSLEFLESTALTGKELTEDM